MGLYYRRRRKVGRNTWLNLSLRGLSASHRVGPLTVSTRGRINLRLRNGFGWRIR